MPVYREINFLMLENWKADLVLKFKKFYNTLDFDLLLLYLVNLYEYIQCFCVYRKNGKSMSNVKVTVNDIKEFLPSKYYTVVNRFYRLRNGIAHTDTNLATMINKLLFDDCYFMEVIKFLNLDLDLINSISIAISTYGQKSKLELNCIDDFSTRLSEIKGKNINLDSIISDLESTYPKCIVDSTVVSVLGKEYYI